MDTKTKALLDAAQAAHTAFVGREHYAAGSDDEDDGVNNGADTLYEAMDNLGDAIEAALSAPESGGGVAEGWRLVPVEPTHGMLTAAGDLEMRTAALNYGGSPPADEYWSTMLSAAPPPPAPVPAVEWRGRLEAIHSTMVKALGDSDIEFLTDDELRTEAPFQWAAQQISALATLTGSPLPAPGEGGDDA